MTAFYSDIANRKNIELTRGQGFAWLNTSVYIKDSTDAATVRTMDVSLGCLLDTWKINEEENGEDLIFSCTGGKYHIPTDKTYTVSIGTKQLPTFLRAALMGHKVSILGSTEKVIVYLKTTLTSTVGSTPGSYDTLTFPGGVLSGDLKKIISVYRKSDSIYLSEVASGPVSGQYTVSLSGTTPVLTIGVTTPATLAAAADYNVIVEYARDIAAGDYVSKEDGTLFSANCDISMSWLRRIEDGPNKGKTGYLIAKLKNCQRTGAMELGADNNAIATHTLEFNVSFQEDGDIEFHEGVLA